MGKSVFPTGIQDRKVYFKNNMDWADYEGARLGISVTNKNKLLAAYGDDTHPESFVYGLKKGHSVPENPISALCFSVVDAIANGYFQF